MRPGLCSKSKRKSDKLCGRGRSPLPKPGHQAMATPTERQATGTCQSILTAGARHVGITCDKNLPIVFFHVFSAYALCPVPLMLMTFVLRTYILDRRNTLGPFVLQVLGDTATRKIQDSFGPWPCPSFASAVVEVPQPRSPLRAARKGFVCHDSWVPGRDWSSQRRGQANDLQWPAALFDAVQPHQQRDLTGNPLFQPKMVGFNVAVRWQFAAGTGEWSLKSFEAGSLKLQNSANPTL